MSKPAYKISDIKKIAFSSTALTTLLTASLLYNDSVLAQTTALGSVDVSASIGSSCSIFSADTMSFGAYTGASDLTAETRITINCSTGVVYTISLTDPHQSTAPNYKLVRDGGNASTSSDYLTVAFKKYGSNSYLEQTVSTIIGTASGNEAVAQTIQGVIAANQTGKTAGTFRKTVSLNLSY